MAESGSMAGGMTRVWSAGSQFGTYSAREKTAALAASTHGRRKLHASSVHLSVVSVPITTDGRTLGMLSTHRRTRAVPTPIELARLHWLSSEAAAILEGTASGLSLRALDVLAR